MADGDAVDYMLSLCNTLKESQDQVASAVEATLRKQGVSIGSSSPVGGKLSRTPTSPTALKTAAMDRIETMLAAVLDRLQGSSPADSPNKGKSRNCTPKAARRLSNSSSTDSLGSARTVQAADRQGQTKSFQDQAAQVELSSSTSNTDSSGPLSDHAIAFERERTRQKLEQANKKPEFSHWSADARCSLFLRLRSGLNKMADPILASVPHETAAAVGRRSPPNRHACLCGRPSSLCLTCALKPRPSSRPPSRQSQTSDRFLAPHGLKCRPLFKSARPLFACYSSLISGPDRTGPTDDGAPANDPEDS